MTEKPLVLVVDDEDLNFKLVRVALTQDFETEYVSSGEACLTYVKKKIPQIILLDINMPGMNGYEVCRQLKATPELVATPIVFVSGLDQPEERLLGYEAGGDDYLVKPFNADELRKKVKVLLGYRDQISELRREKDFVSKTAMEALTTSGELGVVINFLTKSHEIDSVNKIGEAIIEVMNQYGFSVAIRTEANGEAGNFDSSYVSKPLEVTLLQKMKDQGRIIAFGRRLLINYPNISVLIKNFPIDDENKAGRMRDNLALLVEGAQSRITAIVTEEHLNQQRLVMLKLIERHKEILRDIQDAGSRYKKGSAHLIDELITTLETDFITLGLNSVQEDLLLKRVTSVSDNINTLYDDGMQFDERLKLIIDELEKVTRM